MESNQEVRIDKWLWAVRVFKTRSIATNACKTGKVFIKESAVKPSHMVKIGEVIQVKQPYLTRTYKVVGLLEKRVSAKLVKDFMVETTPPEELKKLETLRNDIFAVREKGTGRPTKRDRRQTERFQGGGSTFKGRYNPGSTGLK